MRYADNYCTYRETFDAGKHCYVFTGPCIISGGEHSVTIPGPELYRYRQGSYIQDAMPSVSAEDREFLLSGISPEGWGMMMDDRDDSSIEELLA